MIRNYDNKNIQDFILSISYITLLYLHIIY